MHWVPLPLTSLDPPGHVHVWELTVSAHIASLEQSFLLGFAQSPLRTTPELLETVTDEAVTDVAPPTPTLLLVALAPPTPTLLLVTLALLLVTLAPPTPTLLLVALAPPVPTLLLVTDE